MKSKFFVICKEYKKESNMSQRKYTPLYEKDTKQNQNSPMETTVKSKSFLKIKRETYYQFAPITQKFGKHFYR